MLTTTSIDHTTPTLLAELGQVVAEAITAECCDHAVLRLLEVEHRCLVADTRAHDRLRAERKRRSAQRAERFDRLRSAA